MSCPNDKRHGCTCRTCAAEQTRREAAHLATLNGHRLVGTLSALFGPPPSPATTPAPERVADAAASPATVSADEAACGQPWEVCELCDGQRCQAAPASVRKHPEVLEHFLTITAPKPPETP